MGFQFHRLQWGCIFLLLFFTMGCSMQALKKPKEEKEFYQETSRLEKLTHEDQEASARAKSHLTLAFLYIDYRNPQLNYNRALQEMESYLSLSPGKTQTDDFQNWLAVLKEVEKLQARLEKVQKENKSLQEKIEKIKSLDRQIEERRKLTK